MNNCTDSKNHQNSVIVRPRVLNLQEAGWWEVLAGFIWLSVCPTGGFFGKSNETLGYIICKKL